MWHYQFPKNKFDTGKLWKAADAILGKGDMPGSERLLRILELSRKVVPGTNGEESRKDTREEDMIKRVAAVLAAVGSKSPLSVYDNSFVKQYLELLDPRHSPPYRLERVRILEVSIMFHVCYVVMCLHPIHTVFSPLPSADYIYNR